MQQRCEIQKFKMRIVLLMTNTANQPPKESIEVPTGLTTADTTDILIITAICYYKIYLFSLVKGYPCQAVANQRIKFGFVSV